MPLMTRHGAVGVVLSVWMLASPQCEAAPWFPLINGLRRLVWNGLEDERDRPLVERADAAAADQVALPDTTVSDLGAVLAALSVMVLVFWATHEIKKRKSRGA